MFPGKFHSRNNFKHKGNTISHPFVFERLTSCSIKKKKAPCFFNDAESENDMSIACASAKWSIFRKY